MNFDDLMEEAEAMSKTYLLLGSTQTEGEIAGYWKGERAHPTEHAPGRISLTHIMTLSETLFRNSELDLYTYEPEYALGLYHAYWETKQDSRLRLQREPMPFAQIECTGEPLYIADRKRSLPPFEALCLYGSEKIALWLQEQGFKRYEYWRVRGSLYEKYHQIYLDQYPLFYDSMDVIVGSWPMQWPDSHSYSGYENVHLFTTLRDAEPWIEGWYSAPSKGVYAQARIT